MFTEKFKQRVKNAYPDSPELWRILDNDAVENAWTILGKLRIGADMTIEHRDIMAAQSLEEIQEMSTAIENRKRIFEDITKVGGNPDVFISCKEQADKLLHPTHTGQTKVV